MRYIRWFKEITIKDVPIVGGKNASLGEMYRYLSPQGINIPNGFAITAKAYFDFLEKGKIKKPIQNLLKNLNPQDIKSLQRIGKEIRKLIIQTPLPKNLERQIIEAYHQLSKESKETDTDVAVRSSATAEDLPSASFAGQHETFLNVRKEKALLEAVKKSYESLFLDRAISYRIEKGFNHMKVAISTGVQKMVRSDLGSSGVMFTLDTESGFRDIVVINGIYGLGELIVKGKIIPDEFLVFKPTLRQAQGKLYKPIIRKDLGRKTKKYIYHKNGGIKEVAVSLKNQLRFCLSDEEILTLARWGSLIEKHYSEKNKKWTPQDIEWAKDGKTGELFIVQARPETIHSIADSNIYKEYIIKTKKKPLITGVAIGSKVGYGQARIIKSIKDLSQLKKGEVLVTRMTDPDWTSAMPLASAIITDEGGKTCFEGNTLILTNKGYLPIKDVVELSTKENIETLSLNKNTFKLEWKKVVRGFTREAVTLIASVSQTGRMKNNIVEVTSDHEFITFNNRKLISRPINEIIKNDEGILSVQNIPEINNKNLKVSEEKAYLLGAIFTDGHVRLTKRNGAMYFVQKPTREKKAFIEKVQKYFERVYDYKLHLSQKPPSSGIIRNKPIIGSETINLRCYKKDIAKDFLYYRDNLLLLMFSADKKILLNFLAGVIDGDGTYNEKNNRINIFCSKKYLLEAISIALLRLGFSYQIVTNRNIFNIQIVEGVSEIFSFTSRVKGDYKRQTMGTRFFFAKQLLEDIKYSVNYQSRILSYINSNLLIDSNKIKNYIIPLISGTLANHQLTNIINSPLKMYRVILESRNRTKRKVYNIEVEGNHNYIVFTSRLTPLIVENCHAAIISRELGIPAIVGTKKATKLLKTGEEVTVDCTSGAEGKIFAGKISYETKTYQLKKIPNLKTKISINIGAPDIAFQTSLIPNDGVGLAREEFIIAEKIKIHPLALYYFNTLKDKKLKSLIAKITIEHKDKKQYFIKELAEGIAQIAAAFYPKEVIVRFSDFKTNEYRQLIGGELFEPLEENPMLGWRGASRYYDSQYQPAFEMECQAMKMAIEKFGLKNISVMVPFCRTPAEGKKVATIIKKYLQETKIYVMAEIPSNALLINEFLDIFDGMSIGSNDLTQLVMGIDRDNAGLAKIANENNEAVKKMIKEIIQVCRERKKYVGICGQAPSDYPDFADFLVKEEITAISLNPDTVIKTILHLAKIKE
jgi:pyruvate,water dikinase